MNNLTFLTFSVHTSEGVNDPRPLVPSHLRKEEHSMTVKHKEVLWGQIYYCEIGKTKGSVQAGKRPVLIVQNNRLNKHSPTTLVAMITSIRKKKEMNTHILLEKDCGLKEPSMVMLEQLKTVDIKEELLDYIGCIKYEVGMSIKPRPIRKAQIMCLCKDCQEKMFQSKRFIIKRADPFERDKDLCENCGMNYGYDYIIQKRNERSADHGRKDDI